MLFGPKFVTIFFSEKYLRLAVAKLTGRGLKIYSLIKKELPSGVVFDGRIVNEPLFREVLRTFFLENYEYLKTKNLILALNEEDVFLWAATFEEKPRNIQQAIIERLSPKLPFEPEKAALIYQEVVPRGYQVAATNLSDLEKLANIFLTVGFRLKAILPYPLIFPKLVGQEKPSYLFISSEDSSLIYALVNQGIVAFSSTLKLKKKLPEAEKEIVRTAQEIIAEEYTEKNQEPLRDIFILGDGTNFLEGFFAGQGFDPHIVSLPLDASKQLSGEPADFSRCLSLYFYDTSLLAFFKQGKERLTAVSAQPLSKGVSLTKLLVCLLALGFILLASFFCWLAVKKLFPLEKSTPNFANTKIATPPATPKQATKEAQKRAATEAASPQEILNKADFKIQVLNGTGKAGAAREAQDFLVAKGYSVVSTGNATNFNYQTTTLQVKESKKEITNLLTKDLKERYTVSVGLPLAEGSPFDIVIIIGGE